MKSYMWLTEMPTPDPRKPDTLTLERGILAALSDSFMVSYGCGRMIVDPTITGRGSAMMPDLVQEREQPPQGIPPMQVSLREQCLVPMYAPSSAPAPL